MTSLMEKLSAIATLLFEWQGRVAPGRGRKTLSDLVAGIAVNPLGHGHPAIVDAIRRASRFPLHLSNLYEIPAQETLARILRAPRGKGYRSLFVNSGTEANEAGSSSRARRRAGRV